jgi:hypothetical protein
MFIGNQALPVSFGRSYLFPQDANNFEVKFARGYLTSPSWQGLFLKTCSLGFAQFAQNSLVNSIRSGALSS